MDEKCSLCGGEMLEGKLTSQPPWSVFFFPEGEEKKLAPKKSVTKAYCCKECGNIRIMAVELDKLK
ncbi:MAG: hypothetical protein K2J76_01305 [Oscillospiraceae bacterium]|nr:hypothetical protein [Oscillospiraceae bacterium]